MDVNQQFCAFIDILGFKNKMKNFDKALEFYRKYIATYDAIDKMHSSMLQSISNALQQNHPPTEDLKNSVENILFSDSIILYSADWKSLLFRLANTMSWLLSLGFLFRGGVGYGKHYSNIQLGQMHIVSEGLVQAVEIESCISKYPRIVIGQSALDEVTTQMNSLYDLNNMLIQGEDDLWFINPFFLNPDISPIYETIERDIKKYHSEKFIEKYTWMQKLCQYFYMQNYIRKNPANYYCDNVPKPHFFYPKTFHVQVFGGKNYSLSEKTYMQSFQANIKQVISQQNRLNGD